MRFALALFLVATAAAQSGPHVELSHTQESLRGVSAVSRKIAWASGTHGTFLRTVDGGVTWTPAQAPDATALDFRGVVASSADEAFLMSAGPADQSRIYHTSDGGQHWQLQFTNENPKGFFDSMA
ncbi:MAG: YCF48-related protein, partial [Candidatus Sulfotelmatobacter sp.]